MPLLLLSKPNPLSLGFGLGPPFGRLFSFLIEISFLTLLCQAASGRTRGVYGHIRMAVLCVVQDSHFVIIAEWLEIHPAAPESSFLAMTRHCFPLGLFTNM